MIGVTRLYIHRRRSGCSRQLCLPYRLTLPCQTWIPHYPKQHRVAHHRDTHHLRTVGLRIERALNGVCV